MGMSTDAEIAYGFPLEEGVEFPEGPEGYEDDFLEWVYMQGDDYPVEIITHCSYDYPMYIVAIRGTHTSASRGYPTMIDELPEPPRKKVENLRAWIAEQGLDEAIDGDDGWYLFSVMG